MNFTPFRVIFVLSYFSVSAYEVMCYSRAMQNKAVSYFAAGHRPQHAGRRIVFHACARAAAFILHAARNEIADNSIAPLLVEMQEKLCGLRQSMNGPYEKLLLIYYNRLLYRIVLFVSSLYF